MHSLKIIKKMNFFLIFGIIFFSFNISQSKEPINFVEEVTSKASNVLMTSLDKDSKIEKLRKIAEENVDIRGVGFYSLGKHRKK